MSSEANWKARIDAAVFPAMNEADIDRLMAPLASDRATVPLGGTGAAARVYKLAGGVDAWFQLDGEGRLVAYAVYEQQHLWVKSDQGLLTGAAATPAAGLTFAP